MSDARCKAVALVGRPNVGKSTLFNRLLGRRTAVVSPVQGTTRDRLYGQLDWRRLPLRIIDAGGFEPTGHEPLYAAVQQQLRRALDDADQLVLVCDAQDGLLPADELLMDRLRSLNKPMVVAVNKADDRSAVPADFFRLGAQTTLAVSALHGRGIGELLDVLIQGSRPTPPREAERLPAIAIVGRQNVGKSSLLNTLARQERAIVSEVPGTTRDAVEIQAIIRGHPVVLIDTAGLRHRRKVKTSVDVFSMARTLEAVQRCQVALLVLDATQGVTRDDQRIAARICAQGCGLVILGNKWDLVQGSSEEAAFAQAVRRRLPFAVFAPVIAVSAKTGFRVPQGLKEALQVDNVMRQGLDPQQLLALLTEAWNRRPPSVSRGRRITLTRASWTPGTPAQITLTVNPRVALPQPYQRYLLNALHRHPQLSGIPIRLIIEMPTTRRARR